MRLYFQCTSHVEHYLHVARVDNRQQGSSLGFRRSHLEMILFRKSHWFVTNCFFNGLNRSNLRSQQLFWMGKLILSVSFEWDWGSVECVCVCVDVLTEWSACRSHTLCLIRWFMVLVWKEFVTSFREILAEFNLSCPSSFHKTLCCGAGEPLNHMKNSKPH